MDLETAMKLGYKPSGRQGGGLGSKTGKKKSGCKPCAVKKAKKTKSTKSVKSTGVKKTKKRSPMNTVCNINFNTYVKKVLGQVHPNAGISGPALSTVDNLVKVVISKISCVTNQMFIRSGAKTLSAKNVQNAVKIALGGELSKHAVSEGTKAVTIYASNGPSGKGKKQTKAARAGLTFSVSRVEKIMMLESAAARKGAKVAVYLAAVAEYICAEILEISGNIARDHNKKRITTRHIKLAILGDEELNRLFNDTAISGGVSLYVHPALIKEKKQRSTKTKVKKSPTKKKSPKKKAKKSPKY